MNISCSSAGVPIPTITWTLRDQPTPFEQIDVQTDTVVLFLRDVNDDLVADVTPGSVESTLQIVNAQYPAHDGVYQCTGSNSHAGQNFSQSVTITVQVQGMPDSMLSMFLLTHWHVCVTYALRNGVFWFVKWLVTSSLAQVHMFYRHHYPGSI